MKKKTRFFLCIFFKGGLSIRLIDFFFLHLSLASHLNLWVLMQNKGVKISLFNCTIGHLKFKIIMKMNRKFKFLKQFWRNEEKKEGNFQWEDNTVIMLHSFIILRCRGEIWRHFNTAHCIILDLAHRFSPFFFLIIVPRHELWNEIILGGRDAGKGGNFFKKKWRIFYYFVKKKRAKDSGVR